MLWQIIYLFLGAVCLIYYGVICVCLRKWDSTFSRFWPAAGGLFFLCAALLRYTDLDNIIVGLSGAAALLFFFTEGKILAGMKGREDRHCRYLIVLGAHVEGKTVTDSLKRRLDVACRYLEEHPQTLAVLSGGRGKGEDITEAEAMAGYLCSCGISKERLRLEDRSTTTEENLRFSRKWIGSGAEPVGIVSNNFHLYRALALAGRLGYEDVMPLAAGCRPELLPNYLVREFFAVWKSWIRQIRVRN
ncbi:YdcF family protein [uncultured Merdimonas sp.]|uniref:YdcF family protein n=1 Tax=uncultured Merdimonas sp. TaxID=2023269 RepID=UPI003207E950